ncbi:MAG: hypothetical protein NTX64_07635 [Elusimicrobia bacterium]|nr:hypothetical protein [Elusimicrobiota bacterium]
MTHSRAMRNILFLAGGLALAGSARAATIKPKMTGQPAAVPAGIHYQGRLEDNGIPANNTYTMTFTLYDDPTAGTLVWPTSQDPANINVMAVPVSVGLFSVDLPISTMSLVRAGLKYLQVNINGIDLSPREQLGNVPYAMVAKTIEGTINISTGGFNLQRDTFGSALYVSSITGQVGISTGIPSATLDVNGNTAMRGGVTVAGSSLTVSNTGSTALDATGASALRGAVTIAASTLTVTGVTTSTGIETANGIWVHGVVNAAYLEGDGSAVTNLNGIYLQNASVQTQKLAADAVVNATLLNGSVDTNKLAPDAVTAVKILNATITTPKFAAGAVDTSAMGTDAVTAAKILNATITTAKFAAGAVDTNAMGTDAVTALKILNATITSPKFAPGAVDTTALGSDAVTTSKILNAQITTAKFAAGAVDTTALGTDAVIGAKLLNATITTAKFAPGAVDTTALGTDAVTAAKILNNTITFSKFGAPYWHLVTSIVQSCKATCGTTAAVILGGCDGNTTNTLTRSFPSTDTTDSTSAAGTGVSNLATIASSWSCAATAGNPICYVLCINK